ncbi:MBL fold metallo-hydrolase [Tepidibacter formicigenes]|jgi:7,8-dihydropterin-6-yl-methyl-4-(beta-D-ribofuranosyl)aminobenzene 5'-phosphate synthase|uniref:7,8-dihydropterin-6-yl-methyl-4-(Beta-D-ribofuranosyl)aminobenzene 5'-phosphate synthase n=1 Tax=Tepidibacter formicigenes DSM 15518 TaxID=1123349 RepID=A0A1M6NQA0_9FIRM|nr:MBL fold metallo-hydrolase [Tepidibacter formicigenes]SHJ97786.1 7,8-dihydropterin-6-yl-methyl-4-(beta-D-ribofuranosyl)aminobenzene 5'-phosphate synthase [Tepidibacter formicigenes DSM 15518]
MKLTVLIDNNTLIGSCLYGEPGLSFFIEDEEVNVLFDTGYTDAFIKNAYKIGIDLLQAGFVVISHGHYDHTWGLSSLIRKYIETKSENKKHDKPVFIGHPLAFLNRENFRGKQRGCMIAPEKLNRYFKLNLSKDPVWITDRLVFLGEIERTNHFENKIPVGKIENNGIEVDDYVLDDSAMVYKSSKGLVIITGCSHSGICNIIEYAKKVCKEDRIYDIVGGLHLLKPNEEQLKNTLEYLKEIDIKEVHACHCTDLKSKIELSKVVNLKEVGSGTVLEY